MRADEAAWQKLVSETQASCEALTAAAHAEADTRGDARRWQPCWRFAALALQALCMLPGAIHSSAERIARAVELGAKR